MSAVCTCALRRASAVIAPPSSARVSTALTAVPSTRPVLCLNMLTPSLHPY